MLLKAPPLGITVSLPWGRNGYFLELHNKQTNIANRTETVKNPAAMLPLRTVSDRPATRISHTKIHALQQQQQQ